MGNDVQVSLHDAQSFDSVHVDHRRLDHATTRRYPRATTRERRIMPNEDQQVVADDSPCRARIERQLYDHITARAHDARRYHGETVRRVETNRHSSARRITTASSSSAPVYTIAECWGASSRAFR